MQTLQVTHGLVLVLYYKRHFLLLSPLVSNLTILPQTKAAEEKTKDQELEKQLIILEF